MSLREVARDAVREEVLQQAWRLFAAQGFEATTVDQVAEAAGMSRRTFFRYFESGKDELILARLLEAGERVRDALRARPPDEPAWPALRAAFDAVLRSQRAHPVAARRLQQLLDDEPAARSCMEERRRRWQEMLAPVVAERWDDQQGEGDRHTEAAAVTGAALACLEAAQRSWLRDEGGDLPALLDAAMGAVATVSPGVSPGVSPAASPR